MKKIHEIAMLAAILGAGMDGGILDDGMRHNPKTRKREDSHGRRYFDFPDGKRILAINQESADAQYAKIMKKKKQN